METTVMKWLFDPTVGKLVSLALGLLVVFTLVRLVNRTVTHRVKAADARYRAKKGVTLLGYVAAVVLASIVFSDRLGQLTVAFGVAGAGIAFALQEVIASVAGWVAVAFGGFFKVGDRVQLGGIKGDVIDVGLLRTTLMEIGEWVKGDQYSGRIVRVANSFVFKEPVFNYSGDFPFVWDEVTVPVKHGSDYEEARQILLGAVTEVVGDYAVGARQAWAHVVERYMIEDARIEPMLLLAANDNWVELTCRYVVDYKRRRAVKTEIFSLILDRFDATGGRLGFASATFELVGAPPLDLRLGRRPATAPRV